MLIYRKIIRILFYVAILFFGCNSWADMDFNCKSVEKQRYENLICDYAILRKNYESIYVEQRNLIDKGLLNADELDRWRLKRNNCSSVACMDAVFSEWKEISMKFEKNNREIISNSVVESVNLIKSNELDTRKQNDVEPNTVETKDQSQVVLPSATTAKPSVSTSSNPIPSEKSDHSYTWFYTLLFGIFIFKIGPKKDARFSKGYKDNKVPSKLLKLIGLGMVALSLYMMTK